MESDEFRDLVDGFFGPRATQVEYSASTVVWTGTLYESFVFQCGLNGPYGTFGGGIQIAPGEFFTTFLGTSLSLNSDRDSVLSSLRLVDEWCRLRLPDKFLERYEAGLLRDDETGAA